MSIDSDSPARLARMQGRGGVDNGTGALLGATIAKSMTSQKARAA